MELQEDALIEILARLPVKSLIRLSLVCKYWLNIISSPEFANKHYATRLLQNQDENDSVLILYPLGCSISILSYKNLALETAFKLRPAIDYDRPRFNICHRDVISDIRIYGPCNGLFLVSFFKHVSSFVKYKYELVFLMWNPATREIFRLPAMDYFEYSHVGFGFDSITNDYKAVLFHDSSSGRVLLYSLAANSFRKVDTGFEFRRGCYIEYNSSTPSNGGMHNWVYSESTDVLFFYYYRLLSFDMANEVFVVTPMPYESKYCNEFLDLGSNHMYPTVFYLEERMDGTKVMEIWDLKEYGPTGYWTKQQSITISHPLMMCNLLFWKNKAIVTPSIEEENAKVIMYDLNTQEIKPLRIPGCNTISYTESLVSIAKIASSVQYAPTPSQDQDHISERLHEHYVSIAEIEARESLQDHQEEDSSVETAFQQLQLVTPEIDESSDDSSTDSAFDFPRGKYFFQFPDNGDDMVDGVDIYFLRKKEWEKLSKLPYCLHEVNQPISSNPCIF